MLGKLYANSLMRVLNNRVKVGSGYSEPFLTTAPELNTFPDSYDQEPASLQPRADEENILDDPVSGHFEKRAT